MRCIIITTTKNNNSYNNNNNFVIANADNINVCGDILGIIIWETKGLHFTYNITVLQNVVSFITIAL